MISVITTDAPVVANHLHKALSKAVGISFNKITVDSDTSTNDSCFLLAKRCGGTARRHVHAARHACLRRVRKTLRTVCVALARRWRSMAKVPRASSPLMWQGAANPEDADKAAHCPNSPLVKTAVYGHDAN